jgi:hypothetical protein
MAVSDSTPEAISFETPRGNITTLPVIDEDVRIENCQRTRMFGVPLTDDVTYWVEAADAVIARDAHRRDRRNSERDHDK